MNKLMYRSHMQARAPALALLLALAALAFAPGAVRAEYAATTYGFTAINTDSSNTAGQYSVTVVGEGSGGSFTIGTGSNALTITGVTVGQNQALFVFRNNVGTASSITDVYFQDGTLLGINSIQSSGSGVVFQEDANPPNLPGGDTLSPVFNVTKKFGLSSGSSGSPDGVDSSSEWVGILFDLLGTNTYSDVIAALGRTASGFETGDDGKQHLVDSSGDSVLRIGIHVQSIGSSGYSASFVNGDSDGGGGQNPVPGPSAIVLALSGVFALGLTRVRQLRRRSVVAA